MNSEMPVGRWTPVARFNEVVTTEVDDEVLVYDQRDHHIHRLNHSSAAVWRLCDGVRTPEDIAAAITQTMDAAVSTEMVELALADLYRLGLVEGEPPADFANPTRQSRRDLLRKAAIAGAIAVPAVVSVSAPASAGLGSICESSDDCEGDFECDSDTQTCL